MIQNIYKFLKKKWNKKYRKYSPSRPYPSNRPPLNFFSSLDGIGLVSHRADSIVFNCPAACSSLTSRSSLIPQARRGGELLSNQPFLSYSSSSPWSSPAGTPAPCSAPSSLLLQLAQPAEVLPIAASPYRAPVPAPRSSLRDVEPSRRARISSKSRPQARRPSSARPVWQNRPNYSTLVLKLRLKAATHLNRNKPSVSQI
jgi:hypothetical protein